MLPASSVAAMAASSSYVQRNPGKRRQVRSVDRNHSLLSNPERERLLQHVGGSRESGVAFWRTGSRRTLCLFGQIVRLAMPLPSLIVALEDLNQTKTLSPAPRQAYRRPIWKDCIEEQGTSLVVCGKCRALKTYHEYELRWNPEHESRLKAIRNEQLDLPRRIRATTIQKHTRTRAKQPHRQRRPQ